MKSGAFEYTLDGQGFIGYLAYKAEPKPMPGILIIHDWSGCNDFAKEQARKLAKKGYVALAADMYGGGKVGTSTEENQQLMMPLMDNRPVIAQRMEGILSEFKSLPQVDPQRIVVMGFCLGGLCALDMARSNSDIVGAASFHGLLQPPPEPGHSDIKAKILVLHGDKDPMVSPEQLLAFNHEMDARAADWQVHIFGQALHAFTNPLADDKEGGILYHRDSAARSFRLLDDFLQEVFHKA